MENPAKVAYGIHPERRCGTPLYGVYKYERVRNSENPAEHVYLYRYALAYLREDVEAALVQYAVKGITCFPIFGRLVHSIDEKSISKLAAAGFGGILGYQT